MSSRRTFVDRSSNKTTGDCMSNDMSQSESKSKSKNKMIAITLTGRAPIRIRDADWPIIAEAGPNDWDNTYECQANRTWRASIHVRRHADGRAIISAQYCHMTQFQAERCANWQGGELLAA